MNKLSDTYTLRNGVEIPCIGYGTWQTPDGQTAVEAVRAAIESGYRHIDGAAVYANETSVGEGIRQGMASAHLERKDIFVTSKVWTSERGYEKTIRACENSLRDFGLEYFDLYLIHWPANPATSGNDWDAVNQESWRAMIQLYKMGKARAIGLSNFLPHHIASLMQMEVQPMVDQIENHPGYVRCDTIRYCEENGILVEAWSPLGSGAVLKEPTLLALAEKYDRSVAQLCIRWNLQKGLLPLPKSVTPSRIAENANVFDFCISQEDMATIDAIKNVGFSGNDPDTFNA